jgi:hypothetical protein
MSPRKTRLAAAVNTAPKTPKTPKTPKKTAPKKTGNNGSNYRRRIIDIIIIFFCTGGAVISFILFWRDLNSTLTKQNESPIAIISFKQKTAQRRFGDRVIWDLLKKDSPIYSDDVIHTSDLAEATIFFTNDEASIDIGENTLLQVSTADSVTRIVLSGGFVNINSGNKGAKLILVSSGTEVGIDEGSIVSANAGAIGSAGGAGLQVVKGSANIISDEGNIEAAAGSAISLNAAGQPVSSASVSLLSPVPSARYLSNSDETGVTFSWSRSGFGPNDSARFQIAADQRFAGIIESVDINDADTRTVNLKPGAYWWRVFAVRPGDASGAPELAIANKFLIAAAKTLETIAPAANSVMTRRPSLRFQWSTDENADMYLLQAAADPSLQNPVFQEYVRGDSYTYEGLEEGTWYWRLRALYAADWEGAQYNPSASKTAAFTITRAEPELTAPVLIMPGNAEFINIGQGAKNILFSWKNEDAAANYTLEIANDIDFQELLLVKATLENNYLFNPSTQSVKAGVYFWRVRFEDAGGRSSPLSAVRYFNADENLIVFESVFPPDNYIVNDTRFGDLYFQWNSNLESPSHFQLARDSSFSTLLIDNIMNETMLRPGPQLGRLAEGAYYWRVTNTVNGKNIESAARLLTVQEASRITLESPIPGAEIDGLSAGRGQILVSWTSGEALLNARLIVLRGGEIVFEQQNPGRTVTLPSLSEGVYTWTIQAETAGGFDISPALPSNFRVAPVPRLPVPTGLRPESGQNFGADYLRVSRGISFSWNPVAGANAYIFRLYPYGRIGGSPIVSTSPLYDTSYTISDLTVLDAGGFVWQVEAVSVSPNGAIEQSSPAAESRFVININVPSAPKLPDEETYSR